jgi:hypothetical protein
VPKISPDAASAKVFARKYSLETFSAFLQPPLPPLHLEKRLETTLSSPSRIMRDRRWIAGQAGCEEFAVYRTRVGSGLLS